MATSAGPVPGVWCCSRCSFSHNGRMSSLCEACGWQRDDTPSEESPSCFSSVSASGILSTCALAAAAAAGALVSTGSKPRSGLAGLCFSTLAAVAGAALGLEAVRGSAGSARRKRVASHTKPTSPELANPSWQRAGDAAARMHQQLDDRQDISSRTSTHPRGGDEPGDELMTWATERPLELLSNYSRQLEESEEDQQQAPWHILVAHQQLENMIDQNSYEQLREHFSEAYPSQAAAQEAVNALPQTLVGPADVSGPCTDEEQCCAICLEGFMPEESVRTLPRCGHYYHQGCVDHWLLEHNGSCPVCRSKI